jgi:hypothetical protein
LVLDSRTEETASLSRPRHGGVFQTVEDAREDRLRVAKGARCKIEARPAL